MRGLIRHLRSRGYLAAEEDGAILAVPLNAIGERGDLARFKRDLAEWQAEHRGVLARVEVEQELADVLPEEPAWVDALRIRPFTLVGQHI